jgi:hypothetical protein
MWTPWAAWAAVGAPIIGIAFALRVAVHAGRPPGGVDTWYYLAYADAFRTRPGLDVRLPQYLLQDERQSYPPLFPMALALLPSRWLRRWFWAVSPLIDCVHLALLYWLAFKITASIPVAAVSGCVYAFTPQLISETRSLMPRSFAALLHSIAVVVLLRYVILGGSFVWPTIAVLAGAAVFLASATAATGYVFVCLVLSVVYQDGRYLLLCGSALLVSALLSGGRLFRVFRNYVHAVEYWRRNRHLFGAHPIRHSPIYGDGAPPAPAQRPGFLGGTTVQQLVRLVGENPFILALPLAPRGVPPWGIALYWWASSLVVLSVIATVLPPLRAFGPGRGYLKAAVFPTAYTLAVGIGSVRGFHAPVGIATLIGLAGSIGAIGFFWLYSRRKATEDTASVPSGLSDAVRHLAALPGEGVFCLPYLYSDYTCYNSGKRVLWGGHCGDLRRFEALAPVISRPIPDLLREFGVEYVLIDTLYARAEDVGLGSVVSRLGRWGTFELYRAGGGANR